MSDTLKADLVVLGLLAAWLALNGFVGRSDLPAAEATARIVAERDADVARLRAIYALGPTPETCRLQGKQWVAYRNDKQWTWIRSCADAQPRR